MAVYRARPLTVSAIQWTGNNLEAVEQFFENEHTKVNLSTCPDFPTLLMVRFTDVPYNVLCISSGDFIVANGDGLFRIVYENEFTAAYEMVK